MLYLTDFKTFLVTNNDMFGKYKDVKGYIFIYNHFIGRVRMKGVLLYHYFILLTILVDYLRILFFHIVINPTQ